MPEPAAPLVWRGFPSHVSYSSVNSLADCGERFRLERGYGLSGVPSWALVGGKAFHSAAEFVDIALEAARYGTMSAWPAEVVLGSESTGQESPPITETQHYISDLVAGQRALGKLMAELAGAVAAEVPTTSDDLPWSIRELWMAALDYQVNDQSLAVLKDSHGPLVVPDTATWRAAGRPTKQWPEKENRAWWKDTGADMLRMYVDWRRSSGWTMAYLGTAPAIELDLTATIGDVLIKGFMDRGMLSPILGNAPVVLDLKTNKNEPSSCEQLALYATLLQVLGYPRAAYGSYYMARRGGMGQAHDLSKYPLEYFRWKYTAARALRDSGALIANTSSTWCKSCGVQPYCYATNGELAHLVPSPWITTIN